MKKSKIKKEPLYVYLTYTSYTSGGVPEDDGPFACRSDENIEVSFTGLYREKPPYMFFDRIEVFNPDLLKLKQLYLAVIRYSTGNSFVHTEGAWHVVGVAPTEAIANEMIKQEIKDGETNFKAWNGYFERLTGKETYLLELY